MEDVVLILSVAGVMIFGFFLMKRLDAFLVSNRAAMHKGERIGQQTLRIAFSNPLVANGITSALEGFSKRFPDTAVYLYTGDADTALRLLASGNMDIAFLPASIRCDQFASYDKIEVTLEQDGLKSGTLNLPILPLKAEPTKQLIVWKSSPDAPLPDELLMQIKKDLQSHGGSSFVKMV